MWCSESESEEDDEVSWRSSARCDLDDFVTDLKYAVIEVRWVVVVAVVVDVIVVWWVVGLLW
jgi:hypothetical protein